MIFGARNIISILHSQAPKFSRTQSMVLKYFFQISLYKKLNTLRPKTMFFLVTSPPGGYPRRKHCCGYLFVEFQK